MAQYRSGSRFTCHAEDGWKVWRIAGAAAMQPESFSRGHRKTDKKTG
jgi:hypothetical protein